jgi:ATP-binding cassette, subfamily B, bacterial PglK
MSPVAASDDAAPRPPQTEWETIRSALSVLGPRDRRLYGLAVVLQVGLALLDLVGVVLFGVVGALLAVAASGSQPAEPLRRVLDVLGLSDFSLVDASLVLAAIAACALVLKSALSLLIQTRIVRFLGHRAGDTGAELGARFLGLPLLEVRRHPSQVSAYALIEGVNGLITGTLGNLMIVIGELALLTVLGVALLVLDPLTTVVAIGYFGAVMWFLGRRLGPLARSAGRDTAESNVATRTVTQNAVDTYPEVTVMNRRGYFVRRFATERRRYANAQATMMRIVAVPRYGMEAAMVIGAVLMAATLVVTNDTTATVGGLVLFLAAASRVVPAMLRLNSALITMRNQSASAAKAAELAQQIDSAGDADHINGGSTVAGAEAASPTVGTPSGITLNGVHLTYPGRNEPALADVSFSVAHGSSLALVGPTGAGKSSLVAVLLGLVQPTKGTVRVGESDPRDLLRRERTTLGYVPQDVALVFGTIRENVALAVPPEQIDDDAVWRALRRAHLEDFVASLPEQLDTIVGERGLRLSGGQRQRLGLARALYEPPLLLVLDEATSALDAETEKAVADTITSLAGEITLVTVAHRLATIRHSDVVAYLDQGRLIAHGSFNDVRQAVPGFERQAQLLGL